MTREAEKTSTKEEGSLEDQHREGGQFDSKEEARLLYAGREASVSTIQTNFRGVLYTVHPQNELLGEGVEVRVRGLGAGDGIKVLLHLQDVFL